MAYLAITLATPPCRHAFTNCPIATPPTVGRYRMAATVPLYAQPESSDESSAPRHR
jgi:hypothetical protein